MAHKESEEILDSSSFKDFMLKKEVMQAINDFGYEHPSEVQHSAIPKAILGHDMIVQAKSGMGKTAVFVLSTLSQIRPSRGIIDTLVLNHTREMATQIFYEFERFAKYIDVNISVVYGGVPFKESKRIIEMEKPNILIGTPGRIGHLLESKIISFSYLNRFIIDECDNMLGQIDLRKSVQHIFVKTPRQKQTMMFSATIQQNVLSLCRRFTRNAKTILMSDAFLSLHGLIQYTLRLKEEEKIRKLFYILDHIEFKQVIIFCRTKVRAVALHKVLIKNAFPSICIHGDMDQNDRFAVFDRVKSQYSHRILVATDLMGRGVDLEKVNIVINYDMAQCTDEYMHRVGRAGRFGTKGTAISFESNQEETVIMDQIQERFKIKVMPFPEDITTIDVSN